MYVFLHKGCIFVIFCTHAIVFVGVSPYPADIGMRSCLGIVQRCKPQPLRLCVPVVSPCEWVSPSSISLELEVTVQRGSGQGLIKSDFMMPMYGSMRVAY